MLLEGTFEVGCAVLKLFVEQLYKVVAEEDV